MVILTLSSIEETGIVRKSTTVRQVGENSLDSYKHVQVWEIAASKWTILIISPSCVFTAEYIVTYAWKAVYFGEIFANLLS